MTMKLSDQVAIVTGAGRNIGEDIAKALAAEGAASRSSISTGPRRQGRAAIEEAGGEALALRGRRLEGSRRCGRGRRRGAALRPHRHPRQQRRDLGQQDHPRHHRGRSGTAVIAVTLKSQFLMAKHVARQMVAQGRAGDRQYRLDLGPSRPLARRRLFGGQGRRRQSHARHGGAARAARHPRQRHHRPTRPARRSAATSSIRRGPSPIWSKPPGRSRSRRRAPCCSSSRRIPTSSPAPCCSSTAASAP